MSAQGLMFAVFFYLKKVITKMDLFSDFYNLANVLHTYAPI